MCRGNHYTMKICIFGNVFYIIQTAVCTVNQWQPFICCTLDKWTVIKYQKGSGGANYRVNHYTTKSCIFGSPNICSVVAEFNNPYLQYLSVKNTVSVLPRNTVYNGNICSVVVAVVTSITARLWNIRNLVSNFLSPNYIYLLGCHSIPRAENSPTTSKQINHANLAHFRYERLSFWFQR